MELAVKTSRGITIVGALTNLALAGVANAAVIFTVSAFAQLVGTKSVKITKVRCRNNAAGNTFVHIGTGVAGAFVDLIDPVYSINNMPGGDDNPIEAEAFANITAYPEVLVGAGTIDVQVELAEIG